MGIPGQVKNGETGFFPSTAVSDRQLNGAPGGTAYKI
jgi:hypothetical protein